MKNIFLTSSVLFLLSACGFKQKKADLLIHNAIIYTLDESDSKHKAVAIRDGKIVEIGPEREILNQYVSERIIDAQGSFVYPGFIDGHGHFLGYANYLQRLNLGQFNSKAELLKGLKTWYGKNPSTFIEARGYDQTKWKVQEVPTIQELDALFPTTPVLLRRVDGHGGLFNTALLNLAFPNGNPEVEKGVFVKNNNGELTGEAFEFAVDALHKALPAVTTSEKITSLKKAEKNCFAYGLTTIVDAGLPLVDLLLLDSLSNAKALKMGLYVMASDEEENHAYFTKNGQIDRDNFQVKSFKFYADGSLGSRSALLKQAYSDKHHHHGVNTLNVEEFQASVKKLQQQGFQVNTHCIGDSALQTVLNAYENALPQPNDARWRVEHVQVADSFLLNKFGELAIIPSMQPTHGVSDSHWAGERLGEERLQWAYSLEKARQQLGIIALGTDFPVESPNPLATFVAAVTGKGMDNKDLPSNTLKGKTLSRENTLRGMTLWAALSVFEENKRGSIEVNKFADLVILDRDILAVPEQDLSGTKVLYTIKSGEVVFEK